jgi:cation transport ATPase
VLVTISLAQKQPAGVGLATGSAFLLALCGRALESSGAVPIAAGAARAARSGAFFRDAAAIETTGRVGTVVLPARGTLTEGTPRVTDIETIDERGGDPGELVALAAAACLAAAPGHPVTSGLRAAAEQRGTLLPDVRRPVHRPGRGVLAAAPSGEDLVVGSRALLLAEGVSVAAADAAIASLEERGRTTVLVAVGGRVHGVIGLYDALRPGSREAVDALHALGVEPVILSGDSRTTVEAMAHELGIDHLRAEVEPERRADEVRRLSEAGTTVAVIGHPERDGAALDAADVAIALQSAAMPHGEPALRMVGGSLADEIGRAHV